jgi:hypothetical protein
MDFTIPRGAFDGSGRRHRRRKILAAKLGTSRAAEMAELRLP